MDPVDLILVGCGIMGARHLRGYAALERARPGSVRLRAVCDPRLEAAERVAAEAEALLGYRPRVCASVARAVEQVPVFAADVVTEPRSHAAVVLPLLDGRIHVQVEKPLSVTIAEGRRMAAAARRSGCVLAVAENYRRDPMNRLLRHVLDSGAIGEPQFCSEFHVADGSRVLVTPWRHEWKHGGIVLDMGVHYADMLEYLLGPVSTVAGISRRVRSSRLWTDAAGGTNATPVECDDLYTAVVQWESGVQGTWTMHFGAAGGSRWQRGVWGSAGAVFGPPDRSGQPVRLERGGEVLEGASVVALLPEFRLTGVEAVLFGERPATAQYDFATMDANLIAVETADFLDAAVEGRAPEVSGAEAGLRGVALILALLESAAAGGIPVPVRDVLSGERYAFQLRLE